MATHAQQQHGSLPTRTNTRSSTGGYISDEEAVPSNDPTNTTELLTERLQAWKHMCGYLENYISEVAKDQKSQAKDQEKILKTLSSPLKEGHHFDQNVGGIAGLFENLRSNTQAQSNLHTETSKNLTGSVLPILERLHSEIKNKTKELTHGVGKGTKAVDSARNSSQKHIELLGQHTATFDSAGSKPTAALDPYVIQRQVYHRLNKQLMEENSNRQDLIGVQNSFQQFEAHVIQTVQNAMNHFNQAMSGQADRQKAMYGDVATTTSHIAPDFEWRGFLNRNSHALIHPDAPARTMDSINFPNQNHRATKALIEGSLERKGRGLGSLGGYSTSYYAVTPAGFMHEFKDNDNYRHDPAPETSLYLHDCVIGAVDGAKFSIKGKDTSGSKLTQKLHTTSEYTYKAHTPQDAAEWHRVIASVTGASSGTAMSPVSPVDQKQHFGTGAAAAGAGAGAGAGAIASHPHSASSAHPTSAGGVNQPLQTGNVPQQQQVPAGGVMHQQQAPVGNLQHQQQVPTSQIPQQQQMSGTGAPYQQQPPVGQMPQQQQVSGIGAPYQQQMPSEGLQQQQMPAGGVQHSGTQGVPIGTAVSDGPVASQQSTAAGVQPFYHGQPRQNPLEERKY